MKDSEDEDIDFSFRDTSENVFQEALKTYCDNMIEQSLLCKVLDAPDLEILHSNGVIEEMFLTCKDEIHFIIEHYNSYKQMPDKLTFLSKFKDFQMLEVTESTDYLVYKLKEAYTYTKLVPLIEDTAKVVKEDSIKAIQYLKEEIKDLLQEQMRELEREQRLSR